MENLVSNEVGSLRTPHEKITVKQKQCCCLKIKKFCKKNKIVPDSFNDDNDKNECALCCKEKTAFRDLSHFACPNCMEKGVGYDKYVCKKCIEAWQESNTSCPYCRQELDNTLKVDIIRTPTGKKLQIIFKQKQCCCLKIKKCLKKNMEIIQKMPDCFTIYSWCQAITKISLLHISFGFIAFVFIFGICNNNDKDRIHC
jgi:hypothetical protein